jgi:hypothetical protein
MRRQRRREPPPWRFNWRNEDMHVLRRPWVDVGYGQYEKREQIMTPEESQQFAQETLGEALKPNSGFPDWRTDPSYNWKRKGARKR